MNLQFMSPMVHGILDYVTAATLPICPRMLGFRQSTTHLIDAVAGTVAANEIFTRNEVGLVKAMPMKTHLMMDCVTGGLMMATAAFMDEDEPLERLVVAGIGIHLLTNACLTQSKPTRAPTKDNAESSSPMQSYAQHRRPQAAGEPVGIG
jgi:hypothetical protein